MMLSAFELDRLDGLTRICLRNPYEMHRAVMSGFPNVDRQDARNAQCVLYRVQTLERDIHLYVLSEPTPDWSRLPDGFRARGEPKDLSALLNSFVTGASYAFDLLANPCKKVARQGKNSARVFLSSPTDREAWLRRKGEASGFNILWLREDGQTQSVAQGKSDDSIDQTGIRFRGELTVTDAARFTEAFKSGIGPGKAFGFGMLMLFPAAR